MGENGDFFQEKWGKMGRCTGKMGENGKLYGENGGKWEIAQEKWGEMGGNGGNMGKYPGKSGETHWGEHVFKHYCRGKLYVT